MKNNISRETIRALITASKVDGSTLQADMETERNRLAAEIVTNPESAKEIISGSGNGTSYSAEVNMTKAERLGFLQAVLEAIEQGIAPPSKTYVRFQ